jgi:hypothetical protein
LYQARGGSQHDSASRRDHIKGTGGKTGLLGIANRKIDVKISAFRETLGGFDDATTEIDTPILRTLGAA